MSRREADYWACRKSLRLWPMGEGPDHEEAVKFMSERLLLDSSTIKCLGDFKVQRVPFGPKTKYKNEVLVRFLSVEARDVVRAAATNLAGSGPDVGVRLEVPNHLRAGMKALQSLSFELKSKHYGTRRNILYDDEALDLVLDFCIEEGKWRRVSADQACARKKAGQTSSGDRFRMDDEELDRILGISQ